MKKSVINSIEKQRILLSPLNWGLGHVSRTIPIIRQLLQQENELIVCCNDEQEAFYRNYFPELWYVPFAGYPFQFSGKGKWTNDILKHFFQLSHFLKEEQKKVAELVYKFRPTLIISDQRYGFRSDEVKSIIISHQLRLPLPAYHFIVQRWNKKLLEKFNEIWIPDDENSTFSGILSQKSYKNVHFIGICSQFERKMDKNVPKLYKYVGIISGPFPYNQQFLEKLVSIFSKMEEKTALICPPYLYKNSPKLQNCEVFTDLSPEEFEKVLDHSEQVITRSGYSSIMDLAMREQSAILVPTKGQYEQIYLAKYLKENPLFTFCSEEGLASKI